MSETVRDLRLRLEAISRSSDVPPNDAVSNLLAILADHDDMSISDFLRRLSGEAAEQGRSSAPVAGVNTKEIVSRLRSAMPSDDAFHGAMDRLAAQKKSVTKSVLTQIYYNLFERTQGVPKNATRAELLRLIEDERNIIVRNQKMGNMLGRRVVPAE